MTTLLISKTDIQLYKQFSGHTTDERINPYIKEAQDFDLKSALGPVLFVQLIKTLHTENIVLTVSGVTGTFAVNDVVTAKEGAITVGTGKITDITGLVYTIEPVTGNFLTATTISISTNSATIDEKEFGPYFNLFYGEEYTDHNNNEVIYEGIRPALVYWAAARFDSANNETSTPTGTTNKKNDFASLADSETMSRRTNSGFSGGRKYFQDVEKYILEKNRTTEVFHYKCNTERVQGRRPRITTVDRTKTHRY